MAPTKSENTWGRCYPGMSETLSAGRRRAIPVLFPQPGKPQSQGRQHKQSGHLNFKSAVTSLTRYKGAVSEGSGYQPCSTRAREAARQADSEPEPAQLHRKTRFRRFSHTRRGDNTETRAPLPSPFLPYPLAQQAVGSKLKLEDEREKET